MTPRPDSDLRANWHQLFAAVVDGTATEADLETVASLLSSDPRAMDEYLAYVDLHAALMTSPASRISSGSGRTMTHSSGQPRRRFSSWIALGAASAIAATILVVLLSGSPAQKSAYATLVRSVGGDLRGDQGEIAIGQPVFGGTCELTRGTVELLYHGGVEVVIEAPARFACQSTTRLLLYSGRLTADVPEPAIGFTVDTPQMNVVDLGTRFGVDVENGGETEVHVFQGEVRAQGHRDPRTQELFEGQATRVSLTGPSTNRSLRNSAFVHAGELAELEQGLESGQFQLWQEAVTEFKKDPALVAFFDFNQESPLGEIHGARWVQGRFPGKSALEFMKTDDHVRIDIEGTYSELTMMTWVRLDHIPSGINSLYHTDNWNQPGQVHWMVAEGKQMRFAMHRGNSAPVLEPGKSHWPESNRKIINELGRWVHLATVFDAQSHSIRFFINGEPDTEVLDPVVSRAVLGQAQIGNWNSAGLPFPDRRLSGRMDELVILGRCMSDQEIAAFYAAGTPYRENAKDAVRP